MWSSQAEAEGLTLLKADSTTGYYGVNLKDPGKPKPYQARVRRGGKDVHLGMFATAEEAALFIARSPEGKEAAKRAAAAVPLTSEEARQQARAEGLTLLKADNKTGYFCMYLDKPGKTKPYLANVRRGGTTVHLGSFSTAEEAALCVARTPEGRAAAERPAAAAPLTSEEARQQARAEGLTLLEADNKAGYLGVYLDKPGKLKPYLAQVRRGGEKVSLGRFATAEEAALCVARSPEGQEAAKRAAVAPPLTSEEVGRRGARSLRRKELPGRREQVLSAPGARSAEEAAEEEDVVVVELEAEVVEAEEAEEAEDVQVEVVEVEVVEVMEHEAVVDEGVGARSSEGRPGPKRLRNA